MKTEIERKINEILDLGTGNDLYPDIAVVTDGNSNRPEFKVDNKKVLSFCSANYLGLAHNDEIKEAVIEGIHEYGLHPSGSVLISGTLSIHRVLEKEIANFIGKEDSMIFNTSTMANMGVIPAIINLPTLKFLGLLKASLWKKKSGVIFSDELNHPTIIQGCRLAHAERVVYKHRDVNDLESKLNKYRKSERKLIVTDGVFSVDGTITPLKDIVSLAQEFDAMVLVDDATATGILGENGKGTLEYFKLKGDDVDIIVTAFSKCFGITGGTAIASKKIIDFLRISAVTYIFSGAYMGALAKGVLKALEIIKRDKWRYVKCWENAEYLRKNLQKVGFDTLGSQTPVIPILIGDEKIAIDMARDLLNRGILSPPLRWPATPKGRAIMRFTVTCEHSKEQIDRLVENLVTVDKKHKII